MNRKRNDYIGHTRMPIKEMDEESQTFVWDFPEQKTTYRELTAGRMPSEYGRLAGGSPPLGERNLFMGDKPPYTSDIRQSPMPYPYRPLPSYEMQSIGGMPGLESVGMQPQNKSSVSDYSRNHNEPASFYQYWQKPVSFDTDLSEDLFSSIIGRRRKGLSDYFGTADASVTPQDTLEDYPDFGYYYDTRSNTWKRETPPFYLTNKKYLPENVREKKDLSAYARIFKNYLDDNGETDFVEVPVPYKTDGEVDFTEALLPDDMAARGAARNLWRLYMYKKAPEAYGALEYAKSKGDATVWVPYPYLMKHGAGSLGPYPWQKEIYYKVMQGENLGKLWSDLTNLKAWEWDMPSLYHRWTNSEQQKEIPFKEKPQKNITFDETTNRINKRCLENENNLVLMASLDSIKDAWFTQPNDSACLKTCIDIAKKMGQKNAGNSGKIIPFTYQQRKNGTHYYYGDKRENYKKTIAVIDRHLGKGRTLVGSLDYRTVSSNKDGTDHFVLLVGKGYDKEREQFYYLYADPGRETLQGGVSLTENRIYLDDDRCILSGNKTGKRKSEWSKNYVLTHVRPNDEVQEETESVTNIFKVLSEQSHETRQPFSYEDGDTMFIRDYRPVGKLSQ